MKQEPATKKKEARKTKIFVTTSLFQMKRKNNETSKYLTTSLTNPQAEV